MGDSLQDITVQVEQTVHQIQQNKVLHDDVQPVVQLDVIQCDTSLDESP
ncbi:hypothetical protein A2U01_0104439, partial [Trifolium medium]|nr:hypothetical protein [Trifolium medium]